MDHLRNTQRGGHQGARGGSASAGQGGNTSGSPSRGGHAAAGRGGAGRGHHVRRDNGSPATNVTREATDLVPLSAQLRFLHRRSEKNRDFETPPHQHEARRFLLAALHDERPLQTLCETIGRDPAYGVTVLTQIARCHFQPDAGDKKTHYSYQYVGSLIFQLLARRDVYSAHNRSDAIKIVRTVLVDSCAGLDDFPLFECAIECLERMVAGNSIADPQYRHPEAEAVLYVPKSITELAIPVLTSFNALMSLQADVKVQLSTGTIAQRLCSLVEQIKLSSLVQLADPTSQQELRFLEREAQRLVRVVEGVRKGDEFAARAKATSQDREDERLAYALQMGVSIPLEQEPGPGEIRPDGPRHDNDFVDFRAISVLPTDAEIRCTHPPFLPVHCLDREAWAIAENQRFVANPVDRLLDTQFRLLREDMVASLRRAVNHFLKTPSLMAPKQTQAQKKQKQPQQPQQQQQQQQQQPINVALLPTRFSVPGPESTDVVLFRDAHIEQIATKLKDGLSLQVSFDASVLLAETERGVYAEHQRKMHNKEGEPVAQPFGKLRQARKDFWEKGRGARVLQKQTLVCLLLDAYSLSDVPGNHVRKIAFSVIKQAPRELDDNPQRAYIEVMVLRDSLTELFQEPSVHAHALKMASESVLLQVRGHFYPAYGPVLDALKSHDTSTVALLDSLAFEMTRTLEPPVTRAPLYMTEQTRFDLSCLVNQQSTAPPATLQAVRQRLKSVRCDNYTQLRNLLHTETIAPHLALDTSQINSLAAGLSRDVSLIQGPPGTGKTYIGIQLIRVLLASCDSLPPVQWEGKAPPRVPSLTRPPALPILCVCYTNHALDAVLEALLDVGVPLSDIVRVGGRSSSERLGSRTLHKLCVGKQSKREGYEFYKMKERSSGLEESINTYMNWRQAASRGKPPSLNTARRCLRDYPDESTADIARLVVNGRDEDGFELSGKVEKSWKRFVSQNRARVMELQADWLEYERGAFESNVQAFTECVEAVSAINSEASLRVLRGCKVIGATTSGCASNQKILQQLGAPIIVCEEAGEVFEAHILASLSAGTQQLIMIGDHQQLRPKAVEYSLSVDSRHGTSHVDLSLFERLVALHTNHLKDAAELERVGALCTLNAQRRMHPAISELLRTPILYPQLQDAEAVHAHPMVRGIQHRVWVYDHKYNENGGDDGQQRSYRNTHEAQMAVGLVKYFVRLGYRAEEALQHDRIVVLVPYVGQLMEVRRLLAKQRMEVVINERDMEELERFKEKESDTSSDDGSDIASGADDGPSAATSSISKESRQLHSLVRVSSVDNYQGEESDIVIVSAVRGNALGRTGFLKVSNRVNVMMSRARHGMYILANTTTVRRSKRAVLFNDMLDKLQERGAIGNHIPLYCPKHNYTTEIRAPNEFVELCGDGGCRVPCNTRLKCGHSCPRLCHGAASFDHDRVPDLCIEDVPFTFPDCGHDVVVPCGQIAAYSAGQKPCGALVEFTHPLCGHKKRVVCHQATNAVRAFEEYSADVDDAQVPYALASLCRIECKRPRECGHACKEPCGKCYAVNGTPNGHSGTCTHKCGRMLFCGHVCKGRCHGATECAPCEEKCGVRCVHSSCDKLCAELCHLCAEQCPWKCEHKGACEASCGAPCTRDLCNERCGQVLKCGHRCPLVCGEPCPTTDVSACCRECADPKYLERQVDLISLGTLGETDPTEEPLIMLSCGHLFTVDSLDGTVELHKYYDVLGTGACLPFPGGALKVATCPFCKAVIHNVRRYGRLLNRIQLDLSARRYLLECRREAGVYEEKVAEHLPMTLSAYEELVAIVQELQRRFDTADPARALAARMDAVRRTLTGGNVVRCDGAGPSGGNDGEGAVGVDAMDVVARATEPRMIVARLYTSLLLKLLVAVASADDTVQKNLSQRIATAFETTWDILQAGVKLCVMTQSKSKLRALCELGANMCLTAATLVPRNSAMPLVGHTRSLIAHLVDTEVVVALEGRVQQMERRLSGPVYTEVTAEEKRAVAAAMARDVGSGVGSFGGHWFECPNGHPFAIGECGGAVMSTRCPECGATIGGSGHRLDPTNSVATSFIRDAGLAAPPSHWRATINDMMRIPNE